MPRILLRSPYGLRPSNPGEFQYAEETVRSNHLLWGNAAYALAACIANAFALYGWCGSIRGVDGGGLVEGLPTWVHEFEGGKLRSAVEVLITDRREKEFADLGFIPLVHIVGAEYATFFSVPLCMQPRIYDLDAATANSRLSCQLQYVLTASRSHTT